MDLSAKRRSCITALLLSAGFLTALSTSVTGNLLPAIRGDLGISPDAAQWLTGGAMLASGVVLPLTAAIMGRMSDRAYFLLAMGIFAVGALLSLLAPNFPLLLTGRVLQGTGCGMMLTFVQVLLLALFPGDAHGRVLAAYAMSSALASIIGPGAAGLAADRFGWRSIFFLLTVLAGFLLLAGPFCPANVTDRARSRFRLGEALCAAAGCLLLLLGIQTHSLPRLLIGAGLLFFFCRWQLRAETPLLDLRVFTRRTFALAAVLNLGLYLITMGSTVLLPMLAQDLSGHTAAAYGLATIPGGLLSAAASLLAGRWFDKHGARAPLVLGPALFAAYTVLGLGFREGWGLWMFGTLFALQATALGILNPVLSALALSGLDAQARTDGSALYTALRQLTSALATTVTVTLYGRHSTVWVFGLYAAVTVLMALAAFREQHKTPPG